VTVFEECMSTNKKQRSVCVCGQKDPMQRIFIKKCFLFMVGSVFHVKQFTTGSRTLKSCR
jgi:hypothetical protein